MRDTTSPSELEITDGSMPFSGAGLSFNVGIPCIVSLSQKRARFKAQVKYIGHKDGVSRPQTGVSMLISSVAWSMGGH